jgi:hypothetical protein
LWCFSLVIQQNWVCIFRFFYDFLRILQDSAPSPRSRRDSFTNRPSNFADRPLGRKIRLQLGPWRHGQRRELNSGEGKAQLSRKRVIECSGAHLRPIPGVGRLRGHASEGLSGTSLQWPLRPVFWRTGRSSWNTSDLGSSRGVVGRPQEVV